MSDFNPCPDRTKLRLAAHAEYWCDGHATHVPTSAGRTHHA